MVPDHSVPEMVGWLVGFGRGMRRWKVRDKLGLELDRVGWEPLVQRSYCCCFTQPSAALAPLRDLKGLTARAKAKGG